MTPYPSTAPAVSLSRLARRAHNVWRSVFAPGDVFALLLAACLLLLPVLSLHAVIPQLTLGVLLTTALLGTAFGFLLGRSHYSEPIALMMALVYGVCFVLLLGTLDASAGGVYGAYSRIVRWAFDAAAGATNQDDLVFTLLVSLVVWFMAINITWHIFRMDRVFRAVLPPGVVLVTNALLYSGAVAQEVYLVAYAFIALLLLVRSNLDARTWDWYRQGVRVPGRVYTQFHLAGAALALLAVLLSWSVPTGGDIEERLTRFQQFLQAEPLAQLSQALNRLFSSVDAYGPVTADYFGSDTLQLGGAVQLGNQEVMLVEAPPGHRYYWRSRIFDTYQGGAWTGQAEYRVPVLQPPFEIAQGPMLADARTPVQQRFTMALNATRLIYAAPQPAQVDLAVRAEVRTLPDGATSTYVIRPAQVLQRGASYTVTSAISVARAENLRAASTTYPEWVRNTQLYLPSSVTGRTLALGQQIARDAGASTPYDAAKAIETWLRRNITYNESIPEPPVGQDPVDWVLFDYRQGYCNYYASAMVVMLRGLGIPARLGAGFAMGELTANGYLVRERDAHTWVEVYFPGYGWVEFEPTAAQAPIDRGDVPQGLPPTPTLAPSQTPDAPPTPTVTPTPTNTPTPEPTPPPLPGEQEGRVLPSLTPTPTPSPTPTPVVLPTNPPPTTPDQPQPQVDPSLLWRLIRVITVVLLLTALLAALLAATYWWWEWRGMRGYSPVVRAYARLERYVRGLLHLPLPTQDTPHERQARITRQLPQARRPVETITRMYVAERYGPAPDSPRAVAHHAKTADRAWPRARRALLSRWLRRLLPFGLGERLGRPPLPPADAEGQD